MREFEKLLASIHWRDKIVCGGRNRFLSAAAQRALQYCVDAEKHVVRSSAFAARVNGEMNYRRAYQTAQTIARWAVGRTESLRVLNLSGLNCGHVDLAMNVLLKGTAPSGIRIDEWTAFDSPENVYLENEWLRVALNVEGIEYRLQDFTRPFLEDTDACYDVVLLCEVIEHLDYTKALMLCAKAARLVRPGGLIVITTPNVLWIGNRVRALYGKAEWFDLDTAAHIKHKTYGHTSVYTLSRVAALMHATPGLQVQAWSINHWRFESRFGLKHVVCKLLDWLAERFPSTGFTIVCTATKQR